MKACCVVFCIIVLFHLGSSSEKAKKLHEKILHKSGYNKVIRPVINASDHIDVRLGLKLSQLIDVVSIDISGTASSHSRRPRLQIKSKEILLLVRNKSVNHKSTQCNAVTGRKIRRKGNSQEVQNF